LDLLEMAGRAEMVVPRWVQLQMLALVWFMVLAVAEEEEEEVAQEQLVWGERLR
jgi:hypothetical protein